MDHHNGIIRYFYQYVLELFFIVFSHINFVAPMVPMVAYGTLRHGDATKDWNRQLRVQGTTDVPLNARGRLQAERCHGGIAMPLKKW